MPVVSPVVSRRLGVGCNAGERKSVSARIWRRKSGVHPLWLAFSFAGGGRPGCGAGSRSGVSRGGAALKRGVVVDRAGESLALTPFGSVALVTKERMGVGVRGSYQPRYVTARGVARLRERLSERDLAIIRQVAELRLMSARQIQAIHFPDSEHDNESAATRARQRVLKRSAGSVAGCPGAPDRWHPGWIGRPGVGAGSSRAAGAGCAWATAALLRANLALRRPHARRVPARR